MSNAFQDYWQEHGTIDYEEMVAASDAWDYQQKRIDEFVMAVGIKHPNESRAETALRYIRQAETSNDAQATNGVLRGNRNRPLNSAEWLAKHGNDLIE